MELIRQGKGWVLYGGTFTVVFLLSFYWVLMLLIHSEGETRVPSLVGKTLEEAKFVLEQKKLKFDISGGRFSDRIAAGGILEQSIPAEEMVREGRTVGLFVSQGPQERLTPRVTTMDLSMAETILRSSQLEPVVVAQTCADWVPAGKVTAQQPMAGQQAGKEVRLLVSDGLCTDRYIMADLAGMELNRASEELDGSGFVFRSYREEVSRDVPSRTILSTAPPAGAIVRLGEMITLVVSREASAPVQAPEPVELEEIRWVYLSLHSSPGFFRRQGQLRVYRMESWAGSTFDFLLSPGENAAFATWLSPGDEVSFLSDGQEEWNRAYEPDDHDSPFYPFR
jgi:beta-lactam-binding protein with PASTA domain